MKQLFTFLLVMLLIAGCATISDNKRSRSFENTMLLYEKAIRWGDFAGARRFQKIAPGHSDGNTVPADIRIGGYRIVNTRTEDDGNEINLTVQIEYYHNDTLKLNRLNDEQVWQYTPENDSWHITTPLPAFR